MRRTFAPLAASLVIATTLAAPLGARAQTLPNRTGAGVPVATITVGGQASVDRPPDRAIVRLTILAAAPSATASTESAATAYRDLAQRLLALGLPATAVATTNFSSTFQPEPPVGQRSPDARYGYVTSRSLDVRITPLAHAGAVVDAAAAIGSVTVESVSFDLADRNPARREALASAVRDARDQAEAMASATGVRIVRLVSLATSGNGYQPRPFPLMRAAAAKLAVPTDLAPSGPVETDASVTATYEVH